MTDPSMDIALYQPVLTGEVIETDRDYLAAVYASSGLEEALAGYLDGGSDIGEQEVDLLIANFSISIAKTAWKDEGIDVDLVRFAFEHLTVNMNEVASRKFGHAPQTATRSLLTRLGVTSPEPGRYVRPLDDRYWSKQFMEQYKDQHMVRRQSNETEEQYLARYTHVCIHGFLFAPFTYLA